MYKCLFFLLLQSCFVHAQKDDKNIYQTVIESSAKEGEFFYVIGKKTDSKDLKNIFWEERNNIIGFDINFRNNVDTSWKELLIKIKKIEFNEISIKRLPSSNIEFVSLKRIKNFFRKGVEKGWLDFYSEYPKSKGFRSFSRIIYSVDNNKAVVYLGVHRGSLQGFGTIYFLTYENDKWVINNRVEIWVA